MFYPLKSLFRRHLINLCRHNFGVAIAAFLTFSLVPTAAEAQFGKHNMDRFDVLNVGLGMSNRGLPIFVELEQSLDEHISAGLMASYRSYTEGGAAGAWRHQFLGLGAQGHYHFVELAPPPFDFFAGLTLTWFAHNFKWAGGQNLTGVYTGSVNGGLQLAAHIGGRYTYKDWTLFAQMTGGSMMNDFTIGLSLPLK
jgi:outer membrane immunogenic protein